MLFEKAKILSPQESCLFKMENVGNENCFITGTKRFIASQTFQCLFLCFYSSNKNRLFSPVAVRKRYFFGLRLGDNVALRSRT